MAPAAGHNTDFGDWFRIGLYELYNQSRHVFKLDKPVWATAIRIVPPHQGTVVDELEAYGTPAARGFVDPVVYSDFRTEMVTRSEYEVAALKFPAAWSLGVDVNMWTINQMIPQTDLIGWGGGRKDCNGAGKLYLKANFATQMAQACITINELPNGGWYTCTEEEVVPKDVPTRITVKKILPANNYSGLPDEYKIYVNGKEAASEQYNYKFRADSDAEKPDDPHPKKSLWQLSYLTGCHNRDTSLANAYINNVIMADAEALESSVEAWTAKKDIGCSDNYHTMKQVTDPDVCKTVCIDQYGGCNDGFSWERLTSECRFPRSDIGCKKEDKPGPIYYTAVRGEAVEIKVPGYIRRADTKSKNGAGWLSVSYEGLTAMQCKTSCDKKAGCDFFVFRRPATKSAIKGSDMNCWLYQGTEFAMSSLAGADGFDTFIREETNECLPEPQFQDVPACDMVGNFDGVPTARDRETGGFAAVFSAEGGADEAFTPQEVCAGMGMTYAGGETHVAVQDFMRYTWYPSYMESRCGANIGEPNEHDGIVVERDDINSKCLVRWMHQKPPAPEKYFDRVQCSCSDTVLGRASLHAALLQTHRETDGADRAVVPASDAPVPAVWLSFGPDGPVSAEPQGWSVDSFTSAGTKLERWAVDGFGQAVFDGLEGEVRAQIVGEPRPVLKTSGGLLSITAWMKADELRPGAGVQVKDAAGNFGSAVSRDGQGRFAFFVQAADGSFRGPTSTTVADDDRWYHVAAVYEEGCMAVYVNGTQESKTCDHQGFQEGAAEVPEVLIGHYETDKHSSHFQGSIADVRIFAKALTDDEIRGVMNAATIPAKIRHGMAPRPTPTL